MFDNVCFDYLQPLTPLRQVLIQFAHIHSPPTWKTAAVSLPFLCLVCWGEFRWSVPLVLRLSLGDQYHWYYVSAHWQTPSSLLARLSIPFRQRLGWKQEMLKWSDEPRNKSARAPNICSAALKKYKGLQHLAVGRLVPPIEHMNDHIGVQHINNCALFEQQWLISTRHWASNFPHWPSIT